MKDLKNHSIAEIQAWLAVQENVSERTLQRLTKDERVGVRSLANTYLNKRARIQAEAARVEALWQYEKQLAAEGYKLPAGIDEAGRGPLAGPVVAAAVILPLDVTIKGLNDSKQVSAAQREELFHEIREKATAFGVGIVDSDYIDEHNILQGTYEAMRRAISSLVVIPDHLLNDAVTIPGITIRQLPIIKGDAKSHSIAAASILAKVTRDKLMEEYGRLYPEYGFEKHMGYSTPEHMAALKMHGACAIHRKSFAPVRNVLNPNADFQQSLFDWR